MNLDKTLLRETMAQYQGGNEAQFFSQTIFGLLLTRTRCPSIPVSTRLPNRRWAGSRHHSPGPGSLDPRLERAGRRRVESGSLAVGV